MAPIKEWFGLYNVIFNWFEKRYGETALDEYCRYIAENCFGDVEEVFKKDGLNGIRDYFNLTFDRDNGRYLSEIKDGSMVYKVIKCPDYEFMNSSDNPHFKPIKNYCRHHEIINSILGEKAGYKFCMTECNGKGQCTWEFQDSSSNGREASAAHDGT